jgi:hypothetical protein
MPISVKEMRKAIKGASDEELIRLRFPDGGPENFDIEFASVKRSVGQVVISAYIVYPDEEKSERDGLLDELFELLDDGPAYYKGYEIVVEDVAENQWEYHVEGCSFKSLEDAADFVDEQPSIPHNQIISK